MKLSAAQKDVLITAMRYGGRVRHMSVTTQNILKDRGMIEAGPRVKEDAARQEHATRRDDLIAKATKLLNDGEWRKAYSALGVAYGEQSSLESTCYWITDEGRKAVVA